MDEIHHAILRGDVETVRALVDGEPDLLGLADFDARTPLVLSVLAGSLPLVQYFVEGPAKAEVDEAIPPDGCSALFYACRDGRAEISRYLLAKGADPRQKNRYGSTLPMILCSSAPSMPSHDDEEEEEEAEEEERELPHATVLRLVLQALSAREGGGEPAGAAAAAAVVNARNRNGKTALVMAIEKRRPDLVACLLGNGADPFLMPAEVHHLLPLPSPQMDTAADRRVAALLQDARQAPQRLALLGRVRRMTDAAHALEKVLLTNSTTTPVACDQDQQGGNDAATTTEGVVDQDQQGGNHAAAVVPSTPVTDQQGGNHAAVLYSKLLAAAPPELRLRVEAAVAAAAGGTTPGTAVFAEAVLAALPLVGLVDSGDENDDDGEEEDGSGNEHERWWRRVRGTVRFVALDGGLKPELFVELMAMMRFPWFTRVWEAEMEEEEAAAAAEEEEG